MEENKDVQVTPSQQPPNDSNDNGNEAQVLGDNDDPAFAPYDPLAFLKNKNTTTEEEKPPKVVQPESDDDEDSNPSATNVRPHHHKQIPVVEKLEISEFDDPTAEEPGQSSPTAYSIKHPGPHKEPLILKKPQVNDNNGNNRNNDNNSNNNVETENNENNSEKKNEVKKEDTSSTTAKKESGGETIADEDKWKCPICLDTLHQPVVTRCGHVFCWPCINEWLRRSNSCPVCHGQIDSSHLIPIYGQGDEADLSSPPPPRPEYRQASPAARIANFAEITVLTTAQVREAFRPTAAKIIQLFALAFFVLSFYL